MAETIVSTLTIFVAMLLLVGPLWCSLLLRHVCSVNRVTKYLWKEHTLSSNSLQNNLLLRWLLHVVMCLTK